MMNSIKRVMVGTAALVGLLGPLAIADAADQQDPTVEAEIQHPEWISGCTAWKHSNSNTGFSARCTSGNARYFARAWCQLPGSGHYHYGSYVWPGTTSTGYCHSNEIASNVRWTQ